MRSVTLRRSWIVIMVACCTPAALPAQEAAGSKAKPQTEAAKWNDREYIGWLEERSMLQQARRMSRMVSGRAVQWRHPYGEPQPREAVEAAPVWLLAYPGSVITRPDESVIASWADPKLWETFDEIGIDLLHTGPVKRAGAIRGREYTETIDGWFDRISLEIDPDLGTEADYRRMVQAAAEHGGSVAGDLVPLHTGKGADFRLAQRAYKEYPGMYTMVAIPEKDWDLLPDVADPWSSEPITREGAAVLTQKGYIPGLINSADASLDAKKLSGWDATGPVVGVDGRTRRWVYLHYFKPGQPTLNWGDPSMAAQRAAAGDIVRTIHDLGARVIRLDAVPFLGIEPEPDSPLSLHYQHPLSVVGTNQLAFLTRKLGGFSFQELNVPLVQLKPFIEHGPDLSYDFVTRSQMFHAMLTGDAAVLRQAFGFLLEADLQPVMLVHDLQNHDEITYQLVELDYRGDETFTIGGKEILGRQLREKILRELRTKAAGEAAPWNMLYRPQQDGIATTVAGFIAAGLDIEDPYKATAEERRQIRRAHVLLAHAGAMQPGVFSLSTWDLVGALPLPRESVAERMEDGDYRWINRGAVDLLGANPDATESAYGLPRAETLYGPVPEQLRDPDSFVSQLKRMLAARKKYDIALSELMAVPEVQESSLCLLVLKLPGRPRYAVTALNFGREAVEETLDLAAIDGLPVEDVHGHSAIDAVSGKGVAGVTKSGRLTLQLEALSGTTVVIGRE
jgi:trehalose synthase